MSNYVKPQIPLQHNDGDYFYPLTTADQVIMEDGSRLNSVFKATVKSTVSLLSTGWSNTAPYTQVITVSNVNFDDLNVDANVVYTGTQKSDLLINKAASCVQYIKKNGNTITFYCLKNKPEIDFNVELTGTSSNNIANVTIEEGVKLNFDVVAYTTEEEMIAATPSDNTIGIITNSINGWIFSTTEPTTNLVSGLIWIDIGNRSAVEFNVLKKNTIQVHPMSAHQYVNGSWIDVTAMSYQGGEWKRWITWCFKENEGSFVGDWIGKSQSDVTYNTVIINPTGITFSYSRDINIILVAFSPIIDITYIDTLYFEVLGNSHNFAVGLANSQFSPNNSDWAVVTSVKGTTSRQTITVDTSALSGFYYIAIYDTTTTNTNGYCYNIWGV